MFVNIMAAPAVAKAAFRVTNSSNGACLDYRNISQLCTAKSIPYTRSIHANCKVLGILSLNVIKIPLIIYSI